jgi:chemotaxis protein CheY-P-specific phosphatase CheC
LDEHALAVASNEANALARLPGQQPASQQTGTPPHKALSLPQLRSLLKQALVCEVGDAEGIESRILMVLQQTAWSLSAQKVVESMAGSAGAAAAGRGGPDR